MMFRKVVLGVSGGVDSAVAAFLLKNKGYNVQAVFMQNWDIADEKGYCSADNDYVDACEVCNKLNIPIKRVNFVKQYWNEVFTYLIKEYQSGFTPNPDVCCNKYIKFSHLFQYARENLQADAIATGHYARTSFGSYLENYEEHELVKLLTAVDDKKDQTLFLCQIEQKALQRTMFPLGSMLKSDVKKIAFENGLEKFALKKESMGICFIGLRNFQDFITEYIPDNPGEFIDIDTGLSIGEHLGIHKWTLGQRTKISGLPEVYFTVAKNVKNNIIFVARGSNHSALYSKVLFTEKPHWINSQPEELKNGDVLSCLFKFQHVEGTTECTLMETEKGLTVQLGDRTRAVTPGQYAVFYSEGECLGSAKILFSPSEFVLNLGKRTFVPDDVLKCSGLVNS